jgi:hypothetical protein
VIHNVLRQVMTVDVQENFQGSKAANTRKGNVELAVTVDFADEIDTNALEGLALGLVDRHRESRLDRELVR